MTLKTEEFSTAKTFAQKYGISNYLQFFAKGEDDPEDLDPEDEELDPEDEDPEDDPEDSEEEEDLQTLIAENPELKKQFNKMFKDRFDKRLKGIDLKKAKKLIKEDEQRKAGEDKKDKKEDPENEDVKQLESKLTNKMRNLAVKEYALENGYNHKLVTRLMDKDLIEVDEDGNVDEDDLESAILELEDEFPEIKLSRFKTSDEDEEEDEEEDSRSKRRKSSSHRIAGNKKGNKKKKTDPKAIGAQKALERYKDRVKK